jgi:opacity protein-like surface antigen
MKKQLLAGVVLLGFALCVTPAQAESPVSDFKPYVSVFAGASMARELDIDILTPFGAPYFFAHNGLETGYIIGGAIGVNLTDAIRIEGELSRSAWNSKDLITVGHVGSSGGYLIIADGSVAATYLLANVWLDLKNQSRFTPYFGGGVGAGWASASIDYSGGFWGVDGNAGMGLAYQLGAGLKFDLNESLAVDLGYRFKNIVGANIPASGFLAGGSFDINDLSSHNVQLGLTYSF